jgi:pilus assembly protein TadC
VIKFPAIKFPFKPKPALADKTDLSLFKPKKKKRVIIPVRKRLKFYIEKAGIDIPPEVFLRYILVVCCILSLISSVYFLIKLSPQLVSNILYYIIPFIVIFILSFPIAFFVCWLVLYFYLDLRIYKRRQDVENVLSDFLQLTSANVRAGMTIDKALWFAVKPRFGVLAKEIETVAKETMSGTSLEHALMRFSDKYDSILLKRSIMLLIEGLTSGGEVGDLLNRIASNIQEIRLLRKEMAASVTTYAIFITFATIAAAPFLFALSEQLLTVITRIMASVNISQSVGSGLKFSNKVGVSGGDFKVFVVISLTMTSMFSGMIIATIKNGDVKAGFKNIPFFIIATLTLFFIESYFLGMFFKGMI